MNKGNRGSIKDIHQACAALRGMGYTVKSDGDISPRIVGQMVRERGAEVAVSLIASHLEACAEYTIALAEGR